MTAAELSHALADRIDSLAPELLPGGHREGQEWRAGSLGGEAGTSLGVHLAGRKTGVWSDFATGEKGDALDLVRAVLGVDMVETIKWSRHWLGIDDGTVRLPQRPAPRPPEPDDPDRWRYPWRAARPIAGTLAETYLDARGLNFDDPEGRVLRFAARRARKHPETDELEHHPALICALSDARTGDQCGILNIYLEPDGHDRLRDRRGKTFTNRASGAVVMLSAFDDVAMGITACEGVETGIALFQSEQRPVWACGCAGSLATFPIFGGIECITIAADQDDPGIRAAKQLAARYFHAGIEVLIAAPPVGDWADE
jgi:hypothetical protein